MEDQPVSEIASVDTPAETPDHPDQEIVSGTADPSDQLPAEDPIQSPPETPLTSEQQETGQDDGSALPTQDQSQKQQLKNSFDNSPSSWQIPLNIQPPANNNGNQPYEPTAAFLEKQSQERGRLEQLVNNNPQDLDAWDDLMHQVQKAGDMEAIRDVYERFLKLYPTSVKHWLDYLDTELKYNNCNEVEALFTRCLKSVLSVDLWNFYLDYIRRINTSNDGTLTPDAHDVIEKAYEYVLNNVGLDKDAGLIWMDYLHFLKAAAANGTWEEQRKMDSMRRAYTKAVSTPLNNVEQLWKDYDQWENNLNRLTAKKFLSEKSSSYMTARTALRESRPMMDGLRRNVIPRHPTWTDAEVKQLQLWKKYIQWERNNPLHLEDNSMLVDRVAFAYQQALLALRYYPEIWYDFAMYYLQEDKPDKTLAVLKQAMEILPSSLVLHFAYAELCESKNKLELVRETYDTLLEKLDQEIAEHQKQAAEQVDRLQQDLAEEISDMNLGEDVDGELREQVRGRERQVKREQDDVQDRAKKHTLDVSRQCTTVWIAYMRMARRTEGIKAARGIFSRARKSTNRTYHVFIASALMEYHNSKDGVVAGKIFGLAGKLFADDPGFVCEYLDFLIQMNDDNNTRALFERSLATLPSDKAAPVWKKFLDYENKYGDLASVKSVEKRMLAAIPGLTSNDTFLARHSYLDLDAKLEIDPLTKGRASTDTPHKKTKSKQHSKKMDMDDEPVTDMPTDRSPQAHGFGKSRAPTSSSQLPPPSSQQPKEQKDPQSMVTYILSRLPGPAIYNGPILNPMEMIELLRSVDLTMHGQSSNSLSGPQGPPSGHHHSGMPRGRGRGDGRRGGRGRGMKRKGGNRDDPDDEYAKHHRGMGPNRPPDFDVFRARQIKRHRDDPPM
ncbi:Suf-domain-containing protein [Hesseltinella vesiculosa]|uniref:Suf-domain-containing protein n=1 Tax=Hesseltinella vesiculosa TaxID=101127 RepID=A0A1X2GPT3_9FUNG|nr:Suf-domain-containing protein [Hesseltinella vesiculosa]